MKNFRLLITALAFITMFSACKKDDAPVKPKTKTEMISSASGKKWKLTTSTMTYSVGGQSETEDLLADYDACELDDLYILFADKKFEHREGATKCDDTDLVDSGTWDLRNNDTEFELSSGTDSAVMKVKEISETTLKVEYTLTASGILFTLNQTYQAL
jgi:major membrane immunogen (membrane-anchored lipoprotein)